MQENSTDLNTGTECKKKKSDKLKIGPSYGTQNMTLLKYFYFGSIIVNIT